MLLIAALVSILAAPPGSAQHAEEMAAPADDRLTVSKIHGRAFHVRNGGIYFSLKDDTAVEVNRPVRVGPKSRLDLRVRDGGTLELGPDAQLVLYPPSHAGRESVSVTALRLDQGYLRVVLEAQGPNDRFELSFGRWSAQLQPGEYRFETEEQTASVCTIAGSMQVSGVPEWTAAPEPAQCLQLGAHAPAPVALASGDWERVDARRSLTPVVTEVSRRERQGALASLEARYAETPPAKESIPAGLDASARARSRMPRSRRAPLRIARTIPVAWLETSLVQIEAQITKEQARLAQTQTASAAPKAAAEDAAPASSPLVKVSLSPASEPNVANELALPDSAPALEWIVNVATHPSLDSAQLQAEQLRAQNIATTIRRETVRGRSSYRVVLEGLASEQAAYAAQQDLITRHGMSKAWVFRKR